MTKNTKFFFKLIIILSLLITILLPYLVSIAMENIIEENVVDNNVSNYEETPETDITSEDTLETNNTISNEVIDETNVVLDEKEESQNNEDQNINQNGNQNGSSVLDDLENDTNISIISALTSYENTSLLSLSTSASNGEVDAKISEAVITKVVTGVGPFDEDDEPGNDSSADNNIVRSFDQVSWTIENTFVLKDGATVENYTGGVIKVTASVPSNLANLVKWDIDSMAWAENAVVSDDGTTFTAQYSMSETEITIPGKQTIVLVLKVNNVSNGEIIKPTINVWLEGNSEEEKKAIENIEEVIVSAAPRYNVLIERNTLLNYRSYFDLETGQEVEELTDTSVNGRMQGYGIVVQLYNNNTSKELKGIELPQGEISFDIVLSETKTSNGSVLTDSEYIPILWDYNENMPSNNGKLNRNLYWLETRTRYACTVLSTYNKNVNRSQSSCYDGGIWEIEQTDATTYHVTIKDYVFDTEKWHFPTWGVWTNTQNIPSYVGQFSAGYIQAILQFPENVQDVTSLYLKAEIKNFSATSSSGVITNEEQKTTDNSVNTQLTLYPKGGISKYNAFANSSGTWLWSVNGAGDAYAGIGQSIRICGGIFTPTTQEDKIYAYNLLQKFDDKAFEIPSGSNTSLGSGSSSNVTVLYAAKPDGTGWESTDEMAQATEEDLIYFSTIDELNARGYTCIGVLYEIRNLSILGYTGNWYYISVKVRTDPTIVGQTFATVNNAKAWITDIDFSYLNQEYEYDEATGITTMKLIDEYPTPEYTLTTTKYIKTEYDENGQIISGTNYVAYTGGNSILITGATQSISIQTLDEETSSTKVNYDIGKNEYNAYYKVSPKVEIIAGNNAEITDVNLSTTVTLPKGLKYVNGESNYGDPKITENADGTSTLVWYIYGYTAGEEIEPITFQAHIDEETPNNTQYEVTAVIAEVVGEGETEKIGNARPETRTATTSIQVINLSSYSLYKTTETPVIEVNGTIHYKITAINKTDDTLSDFQLLDILPYNGDGRGTNYNGTYEVEKIEIKTTNTSTGSESTNNLNFYITDNEAVREGVTVKDEDLATTDIWTTGTSGASVNKVLTAYALTGELGAREKLEVDIYLKTDGNEPYDLYKNSATAQTNKNTEKIETSIITVQDVKRELYGYVWRDINGDGLITEGEEYLNGVTVTILNSDGSTAYDINGNPISQITTYTNDEKGLDGYYYFEDMIKGDYKIYVEIDEPGYEITSKEVGANIEINSKFNSDGYTDVITTLNSIESPVITESYVNLGISPERKSISITKVAEEDDSQTLEGAEFRLYKYIGSNSSMWDSQLIDTSNVDTSEWELIGSYTTEENGVFSFEDLQVIHEYRLIETKAPKERVLPTGQWKIEFIYKDYDENDSSLVKIDDKVLRITAVGNPPALKLNQTFLQKISTSLLNTTGGELLLPNANLYTLPSSGSIGITTLYKLAIIAITLGVIIILSTRRMTVVSGSMRTVRKKIKKQKRRKGNYGSFKL